VAIPRFKVLADEACLGGDEAGLVSTGISGEDSSGAEFAPATVPASGIAICTWIWAAWHCGQNGRPSSTVVPHCWQRCSTSMKLAHNEPEEQGNW